MKLKKLIPAAMAGLLLFAGCHFNGNEIDYNQNPQPSSDGTTPNAYSCPSVSVSDYNYIYAAADQEIVLNIASENILDSATIAPALKLYALTNNSANALYAPERAEEIAYEFVSSSYYSTGSGILTSVKIKANLSSCKKDYIAWVLDASKLKLKADGSYALNADGNGKRGEETDSLVGYIPVDNSSQVDASSLSFIYGESFSPKFDFSYTLDSVVNAQGKATGAVKLTVYEPSFSNKYSAFEVDEIKQVFSLNVKEPGASKYANVALAFTYESATHTYSAVTNVYAEGTKIVPVVKHSSKITTAASKDVYRHSAKFSYFDKDYNTYGDTYTVGYLSNSSRIVSLDSTEGYTNEDAFYAQNNLLYVEKRFTTETTAEWYVSFAYDTVAPSFAAIDGFVLADIEGGKVEAKITSFEIDDDAKTVKAKIAPADKSLNCTQLGLYVNEGTVLTSNSVHAAQLKFGVASDSGSGSLAGCVALRTDKFSGEGKEETYYTLSAEYDESTGKVKLVFVHYSGVRDTVYITRNGNILGSSDEEVFIDEPGVKGTVLTYGLFNSDLSASYSDTVKVTINPETKGAYYAVSVTDYTAVSSSDSSYSPYLYIKASKIGTDHNNEYVYLYRDGSNIYSTYSYTYTERTFTDKNVKPNTTYTYRLKNSNGDWISDPFEYTTGPRGSFHIRLSNPNGLNEYTYIYWLNEPGTFGYSSSQTYLYINGVRKSSSSNYSTHWSTFDNIYGCWRYYSNYYLSAGTENTFEIRDADGNVLGSKTVNVPAAYYTISATASSYDTVTLSTSVNKGSAGTKYLYKNDAYYDDITSESSYSVTVEDGEEAVFVIKDEEERVSSNEYTVNVPQLVELNVIVTDENNDTTENTISVHEGQSSGIFSGLWSAELWEKLAELDSSINDSDYSLYGDELLVNSVNANKIKDGYTIYAVSKSIYYQSVEELEVGDSFSDNIADYKITSLNYDDKCYYKVDLDAGEFYAVDFYNYNTKDSSLFSSLKGAAGLDLSSHYVYVYKLNEATGSLDLICYTYSSSRMILRPQTSGIYIIKVSGSYYKSALHVFKDPCVTLNMLGLPYKIPVGGTVYYSSDTSYDAPTHLLYAVNKINTFYSQSYNIDARYDFNLEDGTAAKDADLKAGNKITVTYSKITADTEPADSYSDFTSYKYSDFYTEYKYYYLDTVPGQGYTVELFNGNKGVYSDYEFDDYSMSAIYSDAASYTVYNSYGSSFFSTSNSSKLSFIATGTTQIIKLNTYNLNSNNTVAVHVYKTGINVNVDGETKVVSPIKGTLINGSGYTTYISKASDLSSYLSSYGYSYNSKYYSMYSDEELTDVMYPDYVLSESDTVYLEESVINLKSDEPESLDDFTVYGYKDSGFTEHYYRMPVEKGHVYRIWLYNDYVKSGYSFESEIPENTMYSENSGWKLYKSTGAAVSTNYYGIDNGYKYTDLVAAEDEYYIGLDTYYSNSETTSYKAAVYVQEIDPSSNKLTLTVEDGEDSEDYEVFTGTLLLKNSSTGSYNRSTVSCGTELISEVNSIYEKDIIPQLYFVYSDSEGTAKISDSDVTGGKHLYAKESVIAVKPAGTLSVGDFEFYTGSSKDSTQHCYRLDVEKGKDYTIYLYNNYTASGYGFGSVSGSSSPNASWILGYHNKENDSENYGIYENKTYKEINFTAEEDVYYIVLDSYSNDYKVGIAVFEASEPDTITLTMKTGSEDPVDYEVQLGNFLRKSNGTYTVFDSAPNNISGIYSFLNFNEGTSFITRTYDLYTASDKSVKAVASDIVNGAHLYGFDRQIGIHAAAAENFSEFTVHNYSDNNSYYQYYNLYTEPGTLYMIQLYNGSTASSYSFADVTASLSFNSSAKAYILDKNGNTLMTLSGKTTLFTASDDLYVIKLDTNYSSSNYAVAVNVYEISSYYTVKTKVFGAEDFVDVKVPAESSLAILTAPAAYSSTLTSKNLLSVNDLRAYYLPFNAIDSSNVASYRVYSDEEMTVEAEDADLVAGATLYADNRVRIGTKTTPSVADCTIVCLNPTKSSGFFTMDFEIEVEAGKSYKVIIVDSYSTKFSDYSSYHDTYTYVYADGSQVAYNDDNSFTFNVSSDNEKTYKITVKNRSGASGFCGFYIYKTN